MINKSELSDNNKFSRDLWREVSKPALGKAEADNLLISPYSISTVLSMVSLGAQGTGLQELKKALHVPGEDRPSKCPKFCTRMIWV